MNGIPKKEGDQDTLEELMTISEEELRFWSDTGKDCEYMINDRFADDFVEI